MTERVENLSVRPEGAIPASATSDLLSHVLAQIRLTGDGVILVTVASGDAIPLTPGAGHVCMITDGAALIQCSGAQPAVAASGDLLLLPPNAEPVSVVALEDKTSVVVCRFRFDPVSLRGLVVAIPHYIHIDAFEGASWLGGLQHFMMIEASDVQPGAGLMVSRLIDLAVIRALRTWIQRGQSSGWLGGLADERIARTLKAIHEAPMQRWTLETLARIAGMSRTSFCERFTQFVRYGADIGPVAALGHVEGVRGR